MIQNSEQQAYTGHRTRRHKEDYGHRVQVEMALNFEKPYRTPVQNFSNITAVHSGGYQFKDARCTPALSAKLALRFAKLTHSDFVKPALDTNGQLIDTGLDVKQPDDNYGRVMSTLINEPEDIDKLDLYDPFNPKECPMFTRGFVENISMVARTMDEDFHILGMSWGPFTTAAFLRGAENIMMDINFEPDLVTKLVSKTANFCEEIQLRCIDAGATALWMSDPTASEDMISSEMYEKLAFAGTKQVCTSVKNKTKVPILVHMCGDTMETMKLLPDAGVECFSCDVKNDLAVARKNIGKRMAIMGNIDPVKVLWQGTPESIRDAAFKCIEDAGQEGGFIIAPGCESPRDCSDENMIAMGMAGVDYWMK